jgi:hypothetical protein
MMGAEGIVGRQPLPFVPAKAGTQSLTQNEESPRELGKGGSAPTW